MAAARTKANMVKAIVSRCGGHLPVDYIINDIPDGLVDKATGFILKLKIVPFKTKGGALSFARKECANINVAFTAEEMPAEVAKIRSAPEGSWMGVALLRQDQMWMQEHLRNRGLVARKEET